MSVNLVRIGDIADQIRGVTYAKADASSSPEQGKIPILRAGNIVEDEIVFDDLVYVPDSNVSPKQKIQKHDVLIAASSGSLEVVGKAASAISDFQGGFGAFCKVLRPGNEIDPRYFANYFKSKKYRHIVTNLASGANINNLKNEHLDELKIPLPPRSEQKRIATILDKADEVRKKRQQARDLLDNLLRSTFLEMFGDPVNNEKDWKLLVGKDYSTLLTVGVVIRPASYYTDEGVIALRSLNIKPNRIELESLVFFSKEASEGPLAKSILRTGDVVVVRPGNTGTAAVVPSELDGSNCIDLIIVRPKKGILNPHYLASLMNSESGMALVASKEVGGIQKHFNIGAMNKISFPIPPIDLQDKFAAIVQKAEGIKACYQQSRTNPEHLLRALSQKAFKGEL